MAVNVTEMKGTDSIAGSRALINENFQALSTEINKIENHVDPDARSVRQLSILETDQIRVGESKLSITTTGFTCISDITIQGNLTVTGRITSSDISPTIIEASTEVGSGSAVPSYDTYRVSAPTSSTISIDLFGGTAGQVVTFVYDNTANTGIVNIRKASASATDFVLSGPNTQIELNGKGQSVVLKCVSKLQEDGSTITEWFVVGGSDYTLKA